MATKVIKKIILFFIFYFLFSGTTFADFNILDDDASGYNHWAWNDVIGWIDFQFTAKKNVNARADRLDGYASSPVGYIQLNCNTPPLGGMADCVTAGNWKVINTPNVSGGGGVLSGWAWSENIGWISFSYITGGGTFPYNVSIDSAGEFQGWAWNDVIGWISFNCANDHDPNTAGVQSWCSTVKYRTKTSSGVASATATLTSSVFDGGSDDGVTLNYIMWRGNLPQGASVRFLIASSDKSDNGGQAWNFVDPDPNNPNQLALPDQSIPIKGQNNKRYFRYKVLLNTDPWQTYSPRVDDVIINYAP